MTLITATLSTVIILTNVSTIQAEENNSEPYVASTTSVIFIPEESIKGVSIENQEVVTTTEATEEKVKQG